jgi:flagellar protein FlaI
LRLPRKNTKVEVEDSGIRVDKPESTYLVVEDYFVEEPYSSVKIVKSSILGEGLHYFTNESELDEEEATTYRRMVKILSKELEPPMEKDIDPKNYVFTEAERIAEKYSRSLGKFTKEGWGRIFFNVVRDLAGYGALHTIMTDPNIEDISCNGVNAPIYIWHRKYESIPTNIRFTDEDVLNDFIIKLAHKSSKHISSAQPLLDGMLPEKHRLAATFMNEVSTKGSTFCIRKFRADPYSIVDLIQMGTLNEKIAAYFWMLLENKQSFMILGGTGAGKTSILNSTLSLMSGNDKAITVEEVPELSPPVQNWTQFNTRQSFQFSSAEGPKGITLFDLVKVCLRYRPDYIIVGEVRGEEAYTLFQALATGHGGLCTMHADSLDRAVKRLTSAPMNVAPVYIPLMNSAIQIQKVELPQKKQGLSFGRRVREIWEIEDFEKYREVTTWDPTTDTFVTKFENSVLLRRIASIKGLTMDEILLELAMRELYLREVVKSGVRDQRQVTSKILGYRLEQRTKNDTHDRKKEPQNQPHEATSIKSKSMKPHEHLEEKHNSILKDE